MDTIQVIGAATGVLGAALVTAQSSKVRCAAFSVWVVSNLFIGAFYVSAQAWPLLAMTAVYTATSAYGVWNNRTRK